MIRGVLAAAFFVSYACNLEAFAFKTSVASLRFRTPSANRVIENDAFESKKYSGGKILLYLRSRNPGMKLNFVKRYVSTLESVPTSNLFRLPLFSEAISFLNDVWNGLPSSIQAIINPRDLILLSTFYFLSKKALRWIYSFQVGVLNSLLSSKNNVQINPFNKSWLGFLEPRFIVLTRVLAGLYVANGLVSIFGNLGIFVRPGLQNLVTTVVAISYCGYFIDELKRFYLPVLWPELKEDKRKAFIYNRTTSVLNWFLISLALLQVLSTFLRIPIASTLAFGGVGGIAFGFASKGIFENLFGGLMLLLSEPFVPGDMVHFKYSGVVLEGRIERVGWYQTRLRGRDTRPTYIPNNVFLQHLVTNMDRITHRKFEHTFYIPFQDLSLIDPALDNIKAALKELPKVDLLTPFRVYLVGYGDWSALRISLKMILFFLIFCSLAGMALLKVAKAIHSVGSEIAGPTYTVDFQQTKYASSSSRNAISSVSSFDRDSAVLKATAQSSKSNLNEVNGKSDASKPKMETLDKSQKL